MFCQIRTVRVVRRDRQLALLADAHALQTEVPALDDLTDADFQEPR